jgi:hypothetical protein
MSFGCGDFRLDYTDHSTTASRVKVTEMVCQCPHYFVVVYYFFVASHSGRTRTSLFWLPVVGAGMESKMTRTLGLLRNLFLACGCFVCETQELFGSLHGYLYWRNDCTAIDQEKNGLGVWDSTGKNHAARRRQNCILL